MGVSPDVVTVDLIQQGLGTQRLGRQVVYRESVGSTNDLVKEMARQGAPEGLVVLADEQTAGRGRLGRSWTTPRGSALAMSVLLRPSFPPHQAPRVTLAAAVAVAEAVIAVTNLPVGIKWPNDLLLNGRKFCGILTEMEAEQESIRYLVCGIGINVNLQEQELPPEVRATATSLRAERGGEALPRATLARAVLERLESAYDLLLAERYAELLDRWRRLTVTLGRPVTVAAVDGSSSLSGLAEEIDPDGALLVRTPGGQLVRVVAGEVTLRSAAPQR